MLEVDPWPFELTPWPFEVEPWPYEVDPWPFEPVSFESDSVTLCNLPPF